MQSESDSAKLEAFRAQADIFEEAQTIAASPSITIQSLCPQNTSVSNK